ncbi:MAG TPA: hypothetical protein DCW31_11490 [Lactobacillus sp.]|nr:hypothetical protein [Lactobacillus sp.]
MLKLKPLSLNDDVHEYQLLQQIGSNENGFHNDMFGASLSEYKTWLEVETDAAMGCNLAVGYVPRSTYWLIDDSDMPVGIGRIKHDLTPAMLENSGHIAYAIGQQYRSRGYGQTLCQLLVDECRQFKINPVQVTVEQENKDSNKIVQHVGGVLVGRFGDLNIYQI